MITNNLLLFSLGAHSLLFILALIEWFEAYKKTAPELKKSFLLQTSVVFAYLAILNYITQDITHEPFVFINRDLNSLHSVLLCGYIAFSSSALRFLLFLWARSLHSQLPSHKEARAWVEYSIVFALSAALHLYLWNISPNYWGEWYRDLCHAQLAAFSSTVLYAIVRNKISLYLADRRA